MGWKPLRYIYASRSLEKKKKSYWRKSSKIQNKKQIIIQIFVNSPIKKAVAPREQRGSGIRKEDDLWCVLGAVTYVQNGEPFDYPLKNMILVLILSNRLLRSWHRCSPHSQPAQQTLPHKSGGTTGYSCHHTGPSLPARKTQKKQ